MRFILPALAVAVALCSFSVSGAHAASASSSVTYDQLSRFSQVYNLVQRYYVRDVTDEEMISGALKGMLEHLDPHSAFLTPKEYEEMKETTSGEFFGVGIEISNVNGQVTVVTPIEDTPAYKAGVKAGDLVLAVDGVPTQDMSPQEVVTKIRGEKGTEVELLLLHKDSKSPSTIKIQRDVIPVISVKARYLEDGILWVRLTRFSEKTTIELRAAIADARKKTPIKGIVLDLRNNPGGLLDQAVSVADTFLSEGVIVSMRGKDKRLDKEFKATSSKNDVTEPIVVLVNSGSASAAEIVAGALQDLKRAVLLGERTFGKGSVQQVIPFNDAAIKITTALYFTPSNRSIQAEGIEPNLLVPFEAPSEAANETFKFDLREQNLAGHLENDKVEAKKDGKSDIVDPDAAMYLSRDNQLRMGVQLVKSLPDMQSLHNQ